MQRPTVSIVMPVFNAARYLRQAVKSICDQSFRDFEFIIIDDGSSDQSKVILGEMSRCDRRIKLISRQNTGMTRALNEGISASRGEFIARMDADDFSLPRRLELQLQFMRSQPDCVVVGGQIERIDPDGAPLDTPRHFVTHKEIQEVLLDLRFDGSHIAHPAAFIRREALLAVSGYREEFLIAQDRDLWLRLAEVGQLSNLPQLVLKYRLHHNSLSYSKASQHRHESERAVRDAYARRKLDFDGMMMRPPLALGDNSPAQFIWARMAIRAGNYAVARKHAWAFMLSQPLRGKSWRVLLRACAGSFGSDLVKFARSPRLRSPSVV